jgi:acetylornithine deacetylase/succinyl-diaminopimelate desuccinylase-like protein
MTITRRHRKERIAAAIAVGVLSIAVGAFVLWNKTEQDELQRDTRYIPQKETITPEILLLRDYVRIDTSNAEGVAKGARWLAAAAERHGLEAELIESAPNRLNVYIRVRGKQRGAGLLLLNHIDVVPVDPARWKHPPFSGDIHLNQLWGRGALDMKALAICELLALAAVHRSGVPEHDIAFLATAEEEAGSNEGMQWLLARRPDLFEGIAYAINEGGITEVISERITYFGIEVGSKQPVRTILRAPEKQPLDAARIALEPYITSHERARVMPEVRRFFHDIAPTRVGMGPLLEDIDGTIARGQLWRLPLSYRELLQNSMFVQAPVPSGAGGFEMTTILLNLPDESPDIHLQWLKDFVTPYGVSVQVVQKEGPVPMSSASAPLAMLLASEAQRTYGVPAGSEILYLSTSDCRFLRPRGIQCFGVSPYLVDISQSATIHRADERIRLDWFLRGVGYLERVVVAWASRN